MSKLVVLSKTNYSSYELCKALEKHYENIIELDTTEMSVKEVQEFVKENAKNDTVIKVINGENAIRYRGYYGSEARMVNMLATTKNGQQIGFIKEGNTYKAVLDDMYMYNDEWNALGKTYAGLKLQDIAASYNMFLETPVKKKKKTGRYREDEEIVYNMVG